MQFITKKIHYLLLAISFTFVSTVSFASELTQEEVDERRFQFHGVALFGGTDIFSKGIKIATRSDYSHVGALIHDADADVDDISSWYCFESTGSGCEVLKGHLPHVRVTPWANVVADYSGSVTTRLLGFDDGYEPNADAVTRFVRNFNGRAYEGDIGELFASIRDSNTEADLDTVFCSELTAEMFMELGYMERGTSGNGLSNNWLPAEFSAARNANQYIAHAALRDEVDVKVHRPGRLVRFGRWLRKTLSGLSCTSCTTAEMA